MPSTQWVQCFVEMPASSILEVRVSQKDMAQQWATLRFAVIGELLARPPSRGELQKAIQCLASKPWRTPHGQWRTFGFSTIEKWYYQALKSSQPTTVLRRRLRCDIGSERVMSAALLAELSDQYLTYPNWSYQLHADNLTALVKARPELGPCPSVATVRRRMRKHGWRKRPRARSDGQKRARQRLDEREVRSYEKQHAHALWHCDFHECSRYVVLPDGGVRKPVCFCAIDDYSRLVCHIQWYLVENTENLAHGLIQAFLKRGLPRSLLSDNGAAMLAAETQRAMADLSIVHATTLAFSPYQNGKQETFWTRLEGRLVALLSGVEGLTLNFLNRATIAWVEQEYNRSRHRELGQTPLDRLLQSHVVARRAPEFEQLRFHFTRCMQRSQRRSDGTVSVGGVRYEVPAAMRHVERLTVRFADWDLSRIFVVDPRDRQCVMATLYPQNKAANANGVRRCIEPPVPLNTDKPRDAIPPLLRQILADYAETGMPPAYIPLTPAAEKDPNND